MGVGRRGRLRSRDIRHWALSILGPWVDELHTVPAAWLSLGGHGHALDPSHSTAHAFADLGAQVPFRKTLEGVRTGSRPLPDGGIPRKQYAETVE